MIFKKKTPIALVLHVAIAIRPPPASLAIVTSSVEAGRFEIQDILIFFLTLISNVEK